MPGQNSEICPKQLVTVFRLCDPEGTGRMKIEYLQSLAKVYTAGNAKVVYFKINIRYILAIS